MNKIESQTPHGPPRFVQGALLSLLAFSMWTVGDALTKLVGTSGMPIVAIVGISSWASSLVFVLFFSFQRKLPCLRPHSWKRHGLLALVTMMAAPLNVVSFTLLPLTVVYIGLFLSPLLISVAAALFMKEPLGVRQIGAIVLGFIGVVIALNPWGAQTGSSAVWGYVALFVFVGVFVLYMLLMRLFRHDETAESLAFMPSFVRALVVLPFLIPLWGRVDLRAAAYVAVMGILSGLGSLVIANAYQKAPASIVSPFQYAQIILGSVWGYLLWGDRPSWSLVVGAVVITLAGLAVARDAHQKDQRAREESAAAALLG